MYDWFSVAELKTFKNESRISRKSVNVMCCTKFKTGFMIFRLMRHILSMENVIWTGSVKYALFAGRYLMSSLRPVFYTRTNLGFLHWTWPARFNETAVFESDVLLRFIELHAISLLSQTVIRLQALILDYFICLIRRLSVSSSDCVHSNGSMDCWSVCYCWLLSALSSSKHIIKRLCDKL